VTASAIPACLPLPSESDSSGCHSCAMESSRALRAEQNRMNFPGNSHRFADYSQGSWDMLPLWAYKPCYPRRVMIHTMPVASGPWIICPDFFSSVYSCTDERG